MSLLPCAGGGLAAADPVEVHSPFSFSLLLAGSGWLRLPCEGVRKSSLIKDFAQLRNAKLVNPAALLVSMTVMSTMWYLMVSGIGHSRLWSSKWSRWHFGGGINWHRQAVLGTRHGQKEIAVTWVRPCEGH